MKCSVNWTKKIWNWVFWSESVVLESYMFYLAGCLFFSSTNVVRRIIVPQRLHPDPQNLVSLLRVLESCSQRVSQAAFLSGVQSLFQLTWFLEKLSSLLMQEWGHCSSLPRGCLHWPFKTFLIPSTNTGSYIMEHNHGIDIPSISIILWASSLSPIPAALRERSYARVWLIRFTLESVGHCPYTFK